MALKSVGAVCAAGLSPRVMRLWFLLFSLPPASESLSCLCSTPTPHPCPHPHTPAPPPPTALYWPCGQRSDQQFWKACAAGGCLGATPSLNLWHRQDWPGANRKVSGPAHKGVTFPLWSAPSKLAGAIRTSCWLARPTGVEYRGQVRAKIPAAKHPAE